MTQWFEVNFDGIVGPTHNYSGLSFGNVASLTHKDEPSNPKEAALQGLEKMNFLRKLGLKQAVLPPHARPHIRTLKRLGFIGNDKEVLHQVRQREPWMLLACSSSSSMWAANAATFTPSCDTLDNRVHITPANLNNNFHRSLEAKMTERILRRIFLDSGKFVVHTPLPAGRYLADEGAANHTRLCKRHGEQGFHLFVFNRSSFNSRLEGPHKYPARQTLEASHSISRLHQIDPEYDMFLQQNPLAIDHGVFHNDVISTGNRDLFFYHELAFVNTERQMEKLRDKVLQSLNFDLHLVEVKENEISLDEAVQTYLFNSQIVTLNDGSTVFVVPTECQENKKVRQYLENLANQTHLPIKEIHYLDLRESMHNGGGPACLRCRFVLNEEEIASIHPRVILDDSLYQDLKDWIHRHYRDHLTPPELADPRLLTESREALDELTQILKLGSLYEFQRG